MATFLFNKTNTQKIKTHIENAPNDSQCWFQPTHHGGCLQVLHFTDAEKYEHDYLENTFCNRRTGYLKIIEQIGCYNGALQLTHEWVNMILDSATHSIKFTVRHEINLDRKRLVYGLKTNC